MINDNLNLLDYAAVRNTKMRLWLLLIVGIMIIKDIGAYRMIKNNDGNISTSKETDIANALHCCISGNCSSFYSFADLLDNYTSDETIYITMNMVLPSVIQLAHLKNIAIIGYNNPTVQFGYSGGLQFVHCHNLTIEGIK